MRENPIVPRRFSADHHLERLIHVGWIVGFVDGEGCFSINFVKQPDRKHRKGYRTGFQVAHQFVVTQGMKSVECLEALNRFFGVGRIYVNHRSDNHKEPLGQFNVSSRSDLLEKIVPFFELHPLRTAKRHDFSKFAKCLRMVEAGKHLTRRGLIEIVEIAQTMNHCKPRPEILSALRDQAPAA